MPNTAHRFDLDEVNRSVASTPFAGQIEHLHTTLSTNDLALKAAQSGKRIGVWIADQQIAGRGRGSHTWHSPAGSGLYMTALVAPSVAMQSALMLSLRVAVAVQSAIVETSPFARRDQIDIRWPNDLILNGRKCGGILIDTASNPARPDQPASLRYAIIGIGLNLNQTSFPSDLDDIATSLLREMPQPAEPFRREPLVAAILNALRAEIQNLAGCVPEAATCDCSDPTLCSTWIQGKRVRVEPREGHPGYTGTTAGLNPQGFLLVNGDDGQQYTVLSGGLREP